MSTEKPKCVIFDIDGTLADIGHRVHYLEENPKNWDKFFSEEEVMRDEPKEAIVQILVTFFRAGHTVVLCTGRMAKHLPVTKQWLEKHEIPFHRIYSRSDGDFRPDNEVKQDLLYEILKEFNILFVVDDRDRVVEMWRRNGITCLQCQPGDY